MKPIQFIVSLTISILLFTQCKKDNVRNIKDYYFPLSELEQGLNYEYRAIGQDSLAPDYWFYRDMLTDSTHYLLKVYYQREGLPNSVSREEIVSNGALLNQLHLFEIDSVGKVHQVEATIASPNAFPFEIGDQHTVYLYKVGFQLPSLAPAQTTLIINRRFLGDTTFQFQGETVPAIYFDTRGQVSIRDTINGDIEPRFWGEEIYAKGLGLVAYRQSYNVNERGLEYQLVKRYTEEEFEEIFEGE